MHFKPSKKFLILLKNFSLIYFTAFVFTFVKIEFLLTIKFLSFIDFSIILCIDILYFSFNFYLYKLKMFHTV